MTKNKRSGLFALFKINLWALGLGLFAVLLGAAVISAGAAQAQQPVELPVVMYHSVLKDPARHGKYVISPAEFESDLLYLKRQGYTTILMQDLIDYTQGGALPEKPILITFDDGYYNNYFYAFEIAQRQQCKFVISPICKCTEDFSATGETNAYYTHVTWDHLTEMVDSGLVEVQNHSYNLHKSNGGRLGVQKLPGESETAYRSMLSADLEKAQSLFKEHLGKAPSTFVYPFGATSASTPEIVRELGFSATLTCREKLNQITRDPESLYGLGRYLRVSGISSETFFQKLQAEG